MTDIYSKKKRSWLMSHVRGKNNLLEKEFSKSLSKIVYPLGLRYRKHYKIGNIRPDIVFVKQKIAVFLDGDFWHGKQIKKLRKGTIPEYWINKIEDNIARDKRQNKTLKKQGWIVLRFWQSDLKNKVSQAIEKILSILRD